MNIRSFKFKSLLIAVVLFVCATVCLAQENVISSVTISKSKLDPKGYELNIDSSQVVQYRSYIDGDENIYFDLKNSVLAPNMGTIYDDVSDIDNLTVKQFGKNKVRIYINGKRVKNTDIVFVNSLFEASRLNSNKVTINRPISEYKSTTYHSRDLENQDEMQDWDDNSFNLTHLGSTLLLELKDGFSNKIVIFLMCFVILGLLFKNVASKLAQEKEPLIGLNHSSKKYLEDSYEIGTSKIITKEAPKKLAPIKGINTNQVLQILQNENSINSKRNRAIAQAQEELTRAHSKYQQYLQNKYSSNSKKPTVNVDAIKKGIALSQYQKSTQNPYSNQEVIKLNNDFSTSVRQEKRVFEMPLENKVQLKREFTSPYIQRKTNLVNNEIVKEKPNTKFLDSVTKIYERSGRGDLANGLKKSMTKTKQTI